jgi:hypothetical protein
MLNILNRLREPSSLAGIAVLLGLFGVPAAPEVVQGAGQVLTGLLGLAAVFVREKSN